LQEIDITARRVPPKELKGCWWKFSCSYIYNLGQKFLEQQ